MKKVKIAKRIVLGLLGSAALTSFILFALDVYLVDQAASHATVQTNSTIADQTKLSNETALHAKDEELSIGTSERHMLYQPQDTASSQNTEMDPAKAVPSKQPEKPSGKSTKSQKKQSGSDAELKDKQEKNNKNTTFQTVTEDYFSDALFIGDSRTVGMLQSHLLPNAAYYAKTGIGIGDILSERIVNENGTMISVTDALSRHSFGKVYIMIGINDIARGDVEWFTEQYQNILNIVRQTQPEAVIYIQGNIPMSYSTQDLNGALNNKNLSLRNEASRAFADAENIFYLDINSIYADDNGNLASSYTRDGLHVSTNYYPLWVDYLMQHAIVR